ncbi:protein kinase [Sorangium sp. So ce281]|uniref:protein kinase domain-containing protein n=1 Tax=unclassified Sorangium TaxID=2621164 RepID=UPI003F642A49
MRIPALEVSYHAHDRLRCADVALKTLLRMEAADILRLKSEFRAIADIAHPNLVTLYELISAQGRWFFTMELVSGVSFTRYVRELAAPGSPAHVPERASPAAVTTSQANLHGRAPSPRAGDAAPTASSGEPASQPKVDVARLYQALEQLVHAVEALHGAGKLHLDLKPSNVLVDQSGRVVVLDFGIARDTGARRTALATAGAGSSCSSAMRSRTRAAAPTPPAPTSARRTPRETPRRPLSSSTASASRPSSS